MERVYHVHVIQIGRGSLICNVYRMVEREVPDGESLELGITGLDAVFLLLIELTQAYGHLAASGTGSCDNHERTGGHDIIITAEPLI